MITDFHQVRHITILGVGLIGGSLGLALKAQGFQGKIIGLGRRMSTLEIAIERGVVDVATTDFEVGLRDTDMLIICTPVDLIPAMVESVVAIRATDSKPLLISDVGSVKRQILEDIESFFAAQKLEHLHFIGSHPMAGSHESGVAAAHANLFKGAKCIVTPTEQTDARALQIIIGLWEYLGAELHLLSPAAHDVLIAGASHLPHLIASILANTAGDIPRALDFAGTGFRDTTRIAAGSPEIWTGIFRQNADALMSMIDAFIENLTQFKTELENQNADALARILTQAKTLRESLENK